MVRGDGGARFRRAALGAAARESGCSHHRARLPNALAPALFGADPDLVGGATLVLWGASRIELGEARRRFRSARVIVLDASAGGTDVTELLGRRSR